MNIRFYEGDRIYFRPIELEDEPALRRWRNDPAIWATLQSAQPMNAIREKEWIEKLYKPESQDISVAIVLKDGDRLIGGCGLFNVRPADRSAVFGIMIGDREYQNQGHGTEATELIVRFGFEEMNLNRIGLSVFADNTRGIRAYEKAGFVREGCIRQAYFRNGRYHDELFYGILREEWKGTAEPGRV
jgi:RimJ/RimL family protein N-acetyltransferase